jgi:hypothetical protein
MPKRGIAPLFALTIAAAVVASLRVSSEARDPRRCPGSHARTIVADRDARVVSARWEGLRSWWGCLRGRRPVELALAGEVTIVPRMPRVRSPYVALVESSFSGAGSGDKVLLYHCADRSSRRTSPPG